MLTPDDWTEESSRLAQRGVVGVLPFMIAPSGTLCLALQPAKKLADAPCVLVYPDAAEAITLGLTYTDWLAGLLIYEDWLNRDRSTELKRSLSETAAELGSRAEVQLARLLATAAEAKSLKNRTDRLAFGFQKLGEEAHWSLVARLWGERRESAAQAAGAYVRQHGIEWRLPLRVFTAYLSLRKAPVRLEQYLEDILLDQQLCDPTYSANHYGNVPGSWSDRSEVLYAQWLVRLDRIPSDHYLWGITRALVDEGPDYEGALHAEIAQDFFQERPLVAWRMAQAASVYAGSDHYLPLLRQLCTAQGWSTLGNLLDHLA